MPCRVRAQPQSERRRVHSSPPSVLSQSPIGEMRNSDELQCAPRGGKVSRVVGVSGANGHAILDMWAVPRHAITPVRDAKAMPCQEHADLCFRHRIVAVKADVGGRVRLRGRRASIQRKADRTNLVKVFVTYLA
jgi:hypothetical protein